MTRVCLAAGSLAVAALSTGVHAAPSGMVVPASGEALSERPAMATPPAEARAVYAEPGPGRLVPRPASASVFIAPMASGGVTVSRAADIVGRRTYASRTTIGTSGAMVSFSSRPPRIVSAGPGTIANPNGLPVAAMRMTSSFGMRRHPIAGGVRHHSGVDLAARLGTAVTATADGIVSKADWSGGYGLLVSLEHGAGVQTRYAHLSRLNVTPGQQVRRGEVIGYVGSTGRSTGPHLHYEKRAHGRAVNPLH